MESERQEISEEEKTNIENSLIEFNKFPRVNRKEDIIQWWSKHASEDLKMLANVALALPVTQVSVERTFSGLRYILDELRLSLKDDVIDSIMLLRCNT